VAALKRFEFGALPSLVGGRRRRRGHHVALRPHTGRLSPVRDSSRESTGGVAWVRLYLRSSNSSIRDLGTGASCDLLRVQKRQVRLTLQPSAAFSRCALLARPSRGRRRFGLIRLTQADPLAP